MESKSVRQDISQAIDNGISHLKIAHAIQIRPTVNF